MVKAFHLMDGEPIEALRLCNDVLRDDPSHVAALFMTGCLQSRAEHFGTALSLFERVIKLQPKRDEAWNNAGLAYQECGKFSEAKEHFKRALGLVKKPSYMANLGAAYLSEGNYSEAIRWCKKSLETEDNDGAWTTLGFAHLAQGNWKEGWAGYEHCLGGRFRKIETIGDERKWDGERVGSLFIYGEQGLGDEIMYASILPDAIPRADKIVLECDKRLKGLFQRSFPQIEVRGTRREQKNWAQEREFDAGCAAGSLAHLFRPSRDECPKTPYLIADPERRLQWRTLFDSWNKPVIGIAWSGGRAATQRKERQVGLESFRNLIENTDAVFVSLQYTDADDEIKETGLPVKHIHRAVQSPDYDDTAAFVSELDFIIGPPTTIHHLAGALGRPSTILVPSRPMWDCSSGDSWPWYQSQTFFRQLKNESWAECIRRFHASSHDRLRSSPAHRVQRTPALDSDKFERACQYHAAHPFSAPHQTEGAY